MRNTFIYTASSLARCVAVRAECQHRTDSQAVHLDQLVLTCFTCQVRADGEPDHSGCVDLGDIVVAEVDAFEETDVEHLTGFEF